MEKKRILVVSQHFWPENFRINDICRGFTQADIEVDVLCGLPNYPKGEWFDGYRYLRPRRQQHEGVQVFRSGEIRRKGNTGARIFLNYVSFPLYAFWHLPRLWGRHYDAVFCYCTSPVLMMWPAIVRAKLHREPLTTYVLDLWPENLYSVLPIKNKLLRKIAGGVSHWLYRRSNRLITMSDSMRQKLQAIAPKRSTCVVPQYCEDFYFTPVSRAEAAKLPAGKLNVLFAGNISPAQDLGLLVQCAARLQSEKREDIHFVLVGDGMSREALQAQIASEGLSEYFTFCGQKPPEEVPRYTAAADVLFAALAKSDELGLTVPAKITSYMAAGKPCLVAIDGEAARVTEQARCGLTCPAGDADALYRSLLTLADMTPQKRAAMGRRGKAYCAEHFGREKLLAKLIQFLLYGDEPQE